MTNLHEVVGIFPDRSQAEFAVAAARRKGLAVSEGEAIVEDADGLHVVLRTTGRPEAARQLLLEYGAYRAVIS